MMRSGRILIVEAEDGLRAELDRHLEGAGHDVAAVSDPGEAERLLEEGLEPDVVLAESEPQDAASVLRKLAPRAIHLRIDRSLRDRLEFDSRIGELGTCSSDPGDILRAIEEVLLRHEPPGGAGDGVRCLDLARRLSSSLPLADSPEERIGIVIDGFDTFFGVHGTLVVRHGPGVRDWIEASQGLAAGLKSAVSAEIARRSRHRRVRPFLARLEVDATMHPVACLPVVIDEDREVVLGLVLRRAPKAPGLREAFMNLLGSAMRAASVAGQLSEARLSLEVQCEAFASVLRLPRELAHVTRREDLGRKILEFLRRELEMNRAGLFLPRDGADGILKLSVSSGFDAESLRRLGLSGAHGLGAASQAAGCARRLDEFPVEPGLERERRMLGQAGLHWLAPLADSQRLVGILAFGGNGSALPDWQRQLVDSLTELVATTLDHVRQLERREASYFGGLRGLVTASELHRPEDRGHAERVAFAAVRIGEALDLPRDQLRDLAVGALLHDVGKIGVPATGNGDAAALRMHPVLGSQILARANHPPGVIQGVEQHHERFDGRGYPYGLQREEIHLFGRILAVANAWDRLSSGDSPLSPHDALHRLDVGAGLLYDPVLVAVLRDVAREGRGNEPREGWLEEVVRP